MNEDSSVVLGRFRKLAAASLLVGVIGLLVWFFGGYMSDPKQAMYGYLFAFVFWGSVTVGCFGLLLLQGSLRTAWGVAIARIIEAGGGPVMLITLFVFLIPIALRLDVVYRWTDQVFMHSNEAYQAKLFYLTPNGFWIRAIVIIGAWILFSFLLTRSSRRQDSTKNMSEWGFRANWGSPGIPMFFVTIALLSTDWVMSLDPLYFSTIYSFIYAIGAAISAMCLAVMVVIYNSDQPPFRAIVTKKLTKDFGNVLLTLTMLWAYTMLAQFLITWEANLPMEAQYYLHRTGADLFAGKNKMDWNVLSNFIIIFQFFVPFFALIAPRTKRVRRNLFWFCALMFVVGIFTDYWFVFPSVRPDGLGNSLAHWTDYAAFLGLGGIWFFVFARQFMKAPLLPQYDTRLMEVEHA